VGVGREGGGGGETVRSNWKRDDPVLFFAMFSHGSFCSEEEVKWCAVSANNQHKNQVKKKKKWQTSHFLRFPVAAAGRGGLFWAQIAVVVFYDEREAFSPSLPTLKFDLERRRETEQERTQHSLGPEYCCKRIYPKVREKSEY